MLQNTDEEGAFTVPLSEGNWKAFGVCGIGAIECLLGEKHISTTIVVVKTR